MFGQQLKYKKMWVAYFDILGFATVVAKSPIQRVWRQYDDVLKEVKTWADAAGVYAAWFSDTFLLLE